MIKAIDIITEMAAEIARLKSELETLRSCLEWTEAENKRLKEMQGSCGENKEVYHAAV